MFKDVTTCDFLYNLAQDLNQNKNMVYVLTGQADPNVWRLYSYAYLCHINNESIAIPSVLSYPSTTNFDNTGITYKICHSITRALSLEPQALFYTVLNPKTQQRSIVWQ